MRSLSTQFGCECTVFLAHVPTEWGFHVRCVDELDFPFASCILAVRENPDECADARVVKHILGDGDDRFHEIAFDHIAACVALAAARVTCEDGGAVMHLGDAAAERRILFHLCDVV